MSAPTLNPGQTAFAFDTIEALAQDIKDTITDRDSRLRAEDIKVDARHAAAKSREQMP